MYREENKLKINAIIIVVAIFNKNKDSQMPLCMSSIMLNKSINGFVDFLRKTREVFGQEFAHCYYQPIAKTI